MLEMYQVLLDQYLNNLIITRIYIICAALIFSIPISLFQGYIKTPALPIFWLLANKLFMGMIYRLNTKDRSFQDLILRSVVIVCVFIILATGLVGLFALTINEKYATNLIYGLEFIMLSFSITTITPYLLYRLTKAKNGATYKATLGLSVMRRIGNIDHNGYNRLILSIGAFGFARLYILPLFYYLIGGLPLMIIASFMSWLCAVMGNNNINSPYGYLASLIEKIICLIPNFISATLLIMATIIVPKASFMKALKGLRDTSLFSFLSGGSPLAIIAHGLNISLGGKAKSHHGDMINSPWYGPKDASAKVQDESVSYGFYLISCAQILSLFTLVLFL